ncbi:unnamed protein product [Aureobasidium vineae]|uniref:Peptidase A22B, signal peptide peptidase n=1 Tax=Aureobasidium vineae TaxID=2773715 RepID=A0A9N8JFN3_9PEZI|nr:unnamed protein product [Aureobasidium vineae]
MATNGGDSGPGPISEMLGMLAYGFAQVQPLLPLYTHLVLSALFPIITGAYSSLSRPSTAAKPIKESKIEHGADEQDDQDEDEDSIQKMEGLSPSDAVIFPLLAGCTLGGLYLLIKYMGASLLNKVLRWYFSAMAIFSVAKLMNDGLGVAESFCFPHYYTEGGVLWKVSQPERKAIHSAICTRPSPLPGVLGRIILPRRVLEGFWTLRGLLRRKYRLQLHLSSLVKFKVTLTLRTILSTVLALATIFYSNFVSDEWWLTNLQGFAFSYSALQLMSPTTFGTGSLILSALFFYDIYFVFYTPLMVTVATKLDVPIKLLFPRPLEDGQVAADRKLAMLGLGDIVIPGMMIGLALRFDLHMYYLKRQTKRVRSVPASSDDKKEESASKVEEDVQKEVYRPVTGHWGNKFWTTSWIGRSLLPKYDATKKLTRNPIPTFSKPYFYASIVGYVLGMCVTLGIMQVYRHAQPALLYLVPGVLGSLWLTALVRGEIKQMWDFTEASDEGDEDKQDKKKEKTKKDDDEDKKESTSWWGKSFFSAEKTERNAKRLEKKIAKSVGGDEKSDTEGKSSGKKTAKEEKDANKSFFHFSFTPAVPKTSSLPNDAKKRSSSVDSDSATLIGDSQMTEANGQGPKWRGAGPQETQEERAGKRRRI